LPLIGPHHSFSGGIAMPRKSIFPTRLLAPAAASALLAALSLPAFAGDYGKEVSTAVDHAGYAAASTTIADAHMHLHHAINCLVGPTGAGFDANEMNPCQGQGDGAIKDTTDVAKQQMLNGAVTKAEAGLATDDLPTAAMDAGAVQAMLKQAM
jgi:hypothetical protein